MHHQGVIEVGAVIAHVMTQPASLGGAMVQGRLGLLRTTVDGAAAARRCRDWVGKYVSCSIAHLQNILAESILFTPILDTLLPFSVTFTAVKDIQAPKRSGHAAKDTEHY